MKMTDFAMGDRGSPKGHDLLDVALSAISHGVCMFDEARHLIFCNRAYAAMYDLPAQLTRPGTDLARILEYRDATGNGPASRETYFDVVIETSVKHAPASQTSLLADGRIIKISHNPLDGGGYVAVHEDVTEATRASEQVRFMASHDPLTGLPNRNLLREKLDQLMPLSNQGESLVLKFDRDGNFLKTFGKKGKGPGEFDLPHSLVFDAKGRLLTHSPATYKIPTACDRPRHFTIALWDGGNVEPTINRSKAVGEPPFMLAISVYSALIQAIAATAPERRALPLLDAPATPESILRAIAGHRAA